MRWWRSIEYIKWWFSEATPMQKHYIRNIHSRRRFTRWAIARNHWWGWARDAILTVVPIIGAMWAFCYGLYLLGKVVWWH